MGFVLTEEDPFACADLDGCRDPKTGDIHSAAQSIVDRLDSYAEVSPSGTGLHVWLKGTLPPRGNRTEAPWPSGLLELYDHSRYLTVTGLHLEGTPPTIRDRYDELGALHSEYFSQPIPPRQSARDLNLSDSELIERAHHAKNGNSFALLWNGDTIRYPSHSEADLALCSHLAFWAGGDFERIDRLFRQSGLMRVKWDEPRGASKYGEMTIFRAIEVFGDVSPVPKTHG